MINKHFVISSNLLNDLKFSPKLFGINFLKNRGWATLKYIDYVIHVMKKLK